MPFKKRKEKRELETSINRAELENELLSDMSAAARIKDPAKQIIKLQEINDTIDKELAIENSLINYNNVGSSAIIGGFLTMAAGAASLGPMLGTMGPVGLSALGVGALGYGMTQAGVKRAESAGKKMKLSAADHFENLKNMQSFNELVIDTQLANKIEEIAVSRFQKQMLEIPGIAEKFAAAVVANIAEKQQAVAAVQQAVPVILKVPKPR